MKNKNNLSSFPDIKGRYVVIDTETTGIDIDKDYLISISAIEILDGKITGHQFNGYVRSREKKPNVKENNNNMLYFIEDYSDEIFEIEKHTLQNFLRFVDNSIIFAHNANFDYKFLAHNLKKWNLPAIPYENFRCSLAIAKNIIQKEDKRCKKYTVEFLCRYFGFSCNAEDFHHAYYDAYMCARVICRLYELASKQKERKEIAIFHKNENDSGRAHTLRVDYLMNNQSDECDSFSSEEEDNYEKDPDFTLSDITGHFDKLYIKKNFMNYDIKNENNERKIYNKSKELADDNKDKIKNIMKQYVKNMNQ